ncbi:hypothetical protein SSX86_016645 [Deinandra increscens subsp. villosa]|uniref:Replication factor A C-terminal domain-containing protein n=1 Tax=Deinandra increscens subsp. villosa TaxID=3103831 RepID=A0AAP0GYL3_9ASTR
MAAEIMIHQIQASSLPAPVRHAPTLLRVTNHTASIKIDAVATITPVNDDGEIPRRFFRFTPYEQLSARMEKVDVLTDFIAKVESIEHVDTQNGNSLLRVPLTDLGRQTIVVALWREIVALIDTAALSATDHTVIAAFASVKVIDFHGDMQLESTAATRVEIDPDMQIATELANSFQPPGPGAELRVTYTPPIADRERMTLTALYQETLKTLYNGKYTCEATITEIVAERSWFFVRCMPCKRTILAQPEGYKCPRHGIASLKYRYAVNCAIEDAAGSKAYITVFDEGMNTLLGVKCYDMITKHKYSDATKTPEPVYALKGMRMVFLLQKGEMANDDILSFVVNKVFHPGNDAEASASIAAPGALARLTAGPKSEDQLANTLPHPHNTKDLAAVPQAHAPSDTTAQLDAATLSVTEQQQNNGLAPVTPMKQAAATHAHNMRGNTSAHANLFPTSSEQTAKAAAKKTHQAEKNEDAALKKPKMEAPK